MAKTSKPGKSNRKIATGGMVAVIVVIVLIVVGFFTYISGILPKTLTGVSITETLSDGSAKTVKNFSVLETNFHFKEVYDTYSQYGMVSEDHLDEVYNETTGETYRDWLLREAASQMKTLALVERAAQEADFMQYSKSRDLAAKNLDTLDLYAMMYGFQSGQQYISALYGTGMTRRSYTEFAAREVLVQEYGYYLKQFDPSIVPADDEVQARNDENPDQSYVYDYNYYYVAADKDDDGNVVGLDKAVEAAEKIASAATDSASFRQAVMDYLKSKENETALADYEDDKDPTFTEGLTYSQASYLPSDVRAFIFSDNKAGDVKVIESEYGAYVVYIADKKLNDEQTISYRLLTVNTGVQSTATPEEIAAAADQTKADVASYCTSGMDSLAFYNVVKQHSSDSNEILSGGYNEGVTAESFLSAAGDEPDSVTTEASEWLFDESRKQGDIKILVSEDQKTVYAYYFDASRPAWASAIRTDMITDNFSDWNINLENNNPSYVVNAGLVKYLIY